MMLDILSGHKEPRNNALESRQLINFLVSNNGLIPTPGYKLFLKNDVKSKVRGSEAITSVNGIVYVIESGLYLLANDVIEVLSSDSITGVDDVKIVENNNDLLAVNAEGIVYIYSIKNRTIQKISFPDKLIIDVDYIDSRFVYMLNDGTFKISLPGSYEVYEDFTGVTGGKNVAVKRFKQRLWVFTETETETYIDTGSIPNVYQRSSEISESYGCINKNTVAQDFGVICWIASNKSSSLFIAYSDGGSPQFLSDENIDYLLDTVQNPEKAYGFIYQMDGHTIYHVNFPVECFGIVYDFYSKRFTKIVYTNNISNVLQYKNSYLMTLDKSSDFYSFSLDVFDENGILIPRFVSPSMIDSPSSKGELRLLEVATETGYNNEGYCELFISKDRNATYLPYETKKISSIGGFGEFLRFRCLGSSYFWSFLIKFVVNGKFAVKYVEVT